MRERVRVVFARHPWALDLVSGLAIATFFFGMIRVGPGPHRDGRPWTGFDVLIGVVAVTLIALRRVAPLPVFVVAAAASLLTIFGPDSPPSPLIAYWFAAFTVATRHSRRTAWLAGAAGAVFLYLAQTLGTDDAWTEPATLGYFAWTGMAVGIGDAVRSRRAYVSAIEERARRAEESREEEARRRVVEERMRIARELHDVVAHHVALINVQAGVASHLLRDQPDQAEAALGHVRQAARTVLAETSTLLGVLRQEGDPDHVAEPTRGLSRLSALLNSLAAAGLRVELRQDGEERALPSAVDVAAYRIVQESLTNAQKHGSGPVARLRLGYRPDGLDIAVDNPATSAANGHGGGRGLIGMRERAVAIGGSLDAGRENGRFHVQAFLPMKSETV